MPPKSEITVGIRPLTNEEAINNIVYLINAAQLGDLTAIELLSKMCIKRILNLDNAEIFTNKPKMELR